MRMPRMKVIDESSDVVEVLVWVGLKFWREQE